jgi:hypothetical protein
MHRFCGIQKATLERGREIACHLITPADIALQWPAYGGLFLLPHHLPIKLGMRGDHAVDAEVFPHPLAAGRA